MCTTLTIPVSLLTLMVEHGLTWKSIQQSLTEPTAMERVDNWLSPDLRGLCQWRLVA